MSVVVVVFNTSSAAFGGLLLFLFVLRKKLDFRRVHSLINCLICQTNEKIIKKNIRHLAHAKKSINNFVFA